MDFVALKILALGAAIGFAQTALGMLKAEDWGKLDFCEYALLALKQIHILIICLLGHVVVVAASLFVILDGLSGALPQLDSKPLTRGAMLLLAGYLPSRMLSWFALVRQLRTPVSGIDSIVLKWREIFIEHLREALKLRLIQLHCRLVSERLMQKKLYPFFQQYKSQIAHDLKFDKARRVHPQDYALMTRCLMEWQGYRETAKLLGQTGVLFKLRPLLCPLGSLILLAVFIYALYFLGFFNL
jgi:hypothetical protein